MGAGESVASAMGEATLGYHSLTFGNLTLRRNPGGGQCVVDSLTGAVASQRVTEAYKGTLGMVGNYAVSAMV